MELEVQRIFEAVTTGLPRFEDGRVNYADAKRALVLTVPVVAEGRILLMKRSDKVGAYQGYWSVNVGYFDEPRPVAELAQRELVEETGIALDHVRSVTVGRVFSQVDPQNGREWFTVPVRIELMRVLEPQLDWEHTDWRWVEQGELGDYDLIPGMRQTIERMLNR